MVVADIQNMYTELPVSICRKRCSEIYNEYLHKTSSDSYKVTIPQLNQLLNISLDYSFVEFDNNLYFQYKWATQAV